jgi:hypothetical protein
MNTEVSQVSETFDSLVTQNFRRWTKVTNPVILSIVQISSNNHTLEFAQSVIDFWCRCPLCLHQHINIGQYVGTMPATRYRPLQSRNRELGSNSGALEILRDTISQFLNMKRMPFLPVSYVMWFLSVVGASHGHLPHVGNTGNQVTLPQIGIQATAR